APRRAGRLRRALEEERHRHFKDARYLLQATRADAVSTLLVLLHLLKREAELIGEPFLTHVQHQATHAYAAADIFIGRIRKLDGHRKSPGRITRFSVVSLFFRIGNPRLRVFPPMLIPKRAG